MDNDKKNPIVNTLINFIPQAIVGIVSAVITLTLLQFTVSANTRDIESIKADYVRKDVLSVKLDSIQSSLDSLHETDRDFGVKLDKIFNHLLSN